MLTYVKIEEDGSSRQPPQKKIDTKMKQEENLNKSLRLGHFGTVWPTKSGKTEVFRKKTAVSVFIIYDPQTSEIGQQTYIQCCHKDLFNMALSRLKEAKKICGEM